MSGVPLPQPEGCFENPPHQRKRRRARRRIAHENNDRSRARRESGARVGILVRMQGDANVPTEAVDACPVCGAFGAPLLHEDLSDAAFGVVSGSWRIRRCGCGAAFLDPRPTSDAVPDLYASYYTHSNVSVTDTPNGFAGVLRRLRNGYVNRTLGFDLAPAYPRAGRMLGWAVPPIGAIMARSVRSLGPKTRLLDVGCGDGQFVAEARAMGMEATGLELDPRVVETARAAGLDVRLADLEEFSRQEPGAYDAITMSHLVEHLADPVAYLTAARVALRPGGRLWIATPNIGGAGYRRFGRHWRGLEPPRHMVIFDHASLERALHCAGFEKVRRLRATPVSWYGQARSANGRGGRLPTDVAGLRRRDQIAGFLTDIRAQFDPAATDEVLLLATAP